MKGGLNSFRYHLTNAKDENVTSSNSSNIYNLPQYSSLSTSSTFRQQHHQSSLPLLSPSMIPTNMNPYQHHVYPYQNNHAYPNSNLLNNELHKIQVRLFEARNKNIAMKKNLLQSIQTNYMKPSNNMVEKMDSSSKAISFPSDMDEKSRDNKPYMSKKKDKMDENRDLKNNREVPYSRRSSLPTNNIPSILSNKKSPRSPRRSSKFSEKPQDIDSDDSDVEYPPQKPLRDSKVPPPTPKTTANTQDLALIAQQMARAISDNQAVLAPIDENESITKQKISKETEKKRYKAVMESIDGNYDIMPLWRHRMKGRFNPPPRLILRGKRLFQVIVWGVIIFYARPYASMLRVKRKSRDRSRVELKKNITMLADGCNDWFGQLIRVTLSSMENDPSLDFEPTDSFTSNRNKPLKQRLLQLKIRVKAIIDSITNSELPAHFVEILVTTIDDGNYFFKEFLFEYEDKLLEYDILGGTRNMLILPRMNYNYNGKPKILYEVGKSRMQIDVKRARTIIQNLILIKMLVSHILLSPWSFGVLKKPVNNIKRVVNNHRVLATVIYEIVRIVDPELPPIEQAAFVPSAQTPIIPSVQTPITPSVKTPIVPSGQTDSKESENKPESTEVPLDKATEVPPDKATEVLPDKATEEKITVPSDGAKVQENVKKIDKKINQPEFDSRLEKFFGAVLGRTKKSKSEIGADSVEERILGPRNPFGSLQELHRNLILASEFDAAKKEINGWMQDYANLMEVWIEKSVQTVLNRRHQIIANDIGGDDNAQNMLGSLTTRRESARNLKTTSRIPKLDFGNI